MSKLAIFLIVLLIFVSPVTADDSDCDCDECGYTKSAICETATVIMDACLKETQGNRTLCQAIVSEVNDQTEKIVKDVYEAHWDFTGLGGWSCNTRAFNWPSACDDSNSAAGAVPLGILTAGSIAVSSLVF